MLVVKPLSLIVHLEASWFKGAKVKHEVRRYCGRG
jgi:hypothetical protein